jgi:DNA polymerase-3 subunit delta
MNVARYDVSDLRDALKAATRCAPRARWKASRARMRRKPLVLWALATEARNSAARPALLHAAKIDRMIKGLARGDVWDEFLQLALRLTQPRTR